MPRRSGQDVCREAAGIIERRGWTQGVFEGPRGEVCMVGALNEAATGSPIPPTLEPAEVRRATFLIFEAFEKLRLRGTASLAEWNDRLGRTQDEVLKVLRTAAEIEGMPLQTKEETA